jgi:hypothetical protein
MNEINHFKFFVLYSGDVISHVDYLHVKRIYLVNFSYIVIEDVWFALWLHCFSFFFEVSYIASLFFR